MNPHQSPTARVRDPEYHVVTREIDDRHFSKHEQRVSKNFLFFQVLGLTSPAYKGGVMEGDVLVSVEDTLVTLMKHAQVKIDMNVLSVSCVKCYSNSHKR